MSTNAITRYVPWNEGAEILGVGRSSFFYLVESGQISVEPGRGPRSGRYSLEDIQRIAEMERYRQWSPKNGQLAIAAFDARSNRQTMLAYLACLPLDQGFTVFWALSAQQECHRSSA